MQKHDDASFHYDGQFPADLPKTAGGTHIGFFVAWLVLNGHFESALYEEHPGEVAALRARRMTGRDFLFDVLDEKLLEEDLTEAGHRFAQAYYDEIYFDDYVDFLVPEEMDSLYRVDDTWANYDKLAQRIDQRYAAWSKDGKLELTT
jgi:hypothetical protein